MGETQAVSRYKIRNLAETIEVLFEISDAVSHTRNLAELYKVIHGAMDKILNVDNFYIALLDKERDAITFPYHMDERKNIPVEILNFSQKPTTTGLVIKSKKPMMFYEKDILKMAMEVGKPILGTAAKVWLGAPLVIKNRVIGAMVIQDYSCAAAYGKKDLVLLNSISQHVALAIERKEAEEKIKDQGRILEKILESSPVGIALVQNRIFQWVNGEMVRMFGYEAKEAFQNKSVRMIYLAEEDYEYAGQTIYDSLITRGKADYEIEVKKKNGGLFPAHIRLNCTDNEDPMAWTIATVTDISQRKAAEKETYERERLQGVLEMAGAVCHEINQPLQAI
ncbi:MAG: PAS domain S-box protein, partial [Proteobacteria bacterium]|nr:PAS domain S-box protein [Pseudomonadota bacterium]